MCPSRYAPLRWLVVTSVRQCCRHSPILGFPAYGGALFARGVLATQFTAHCAVIRMVVVGGPVDREKTSYWHTRKIRTKWGGEEEEEVHVSCRGDGRIAARSRRDGGREREIKTAGILFLDDDGPDSVLAKHAYCYVCGGIYPGHVQCVAAFTTLFVTMRLSRADFAPPSLTPFGNHGVKAAQFAYSSNHYTWYFSIILLGTTVPDHIRKYCPWKYLVGKVDAKSNALLSIEPPKAIHRTACITLVDRGKNPHIAQQPYAVYTYSTSNRILLILLLVRSQPHDVGIASIRVNPQNGVYLCRFFYATRLPGGVLLL